MSQSDEGGRRPESAATLRYAGRILKQSQALLQRSKELRETANALRERANDARNRRPRILADAPPLDQFGDQNGSSN